MKRLSVYTCLIKYKLSLAVAFSSVTGYLISGELISLSLLYLAAGVFFLAAGAAAMNQYSERRTDLLMDRTKDRPLPSGEISEKQALSFAVILFIAGTVLLFKNGILPVSLGLLNVVLYNLVYTRLKKTTILSIIPGGFVGAIPPMIGYSSSGSNLVSPDIIAFSIFMFLWQVPHFWLIIARYGEEYRKAGLATISTYLNNIQIRILVFCWVLVSNTMLIIFFLIADLLIIQFSVPFILFNIGFIFLFSHNLFGINKQQEVRGAMILINSYGLFIMLLFIAVSVKHML